MDIYLVDIKPENMLLCSDGLYFIDVDDISIVRKDYIDISNTTTQYFNTADYKSFVGRNEDFVKKHQAFMKEHTDITFSPAATKQLEEIRERLEYEGWQALIKTYFSLQFRTFFRYDKVKEQLKQIAYDPNKYDPLLEQKEHLLTLLRPYYVNILKPSYIDYFKETYLHDFPKTFATSVSGNKVNQKTVLKNINDFYKAKGTEKSYNLLFKILHDSDVSFYYPKEDILRVSDGKWVEKKSIKITSENGNSNFSIRNRTVEQIDPSLNGAVTAYANVDNVYQYELNQYKITELFLTDINGTFTQGSKVQCTLADGTKIIEEIYTVPSNVTISNGGLGYKSGDTIEIDTTSSDYVSGSGAKGSVTRVSNTGIIQTAQIDNFGVNYQSSNDSNSIPVTFTSGSGFGASGSVDLDALCTYPGYYANNDGKLSSNKRMRDNELYQEYSYVLKTEISLSAYKEQVKKLVHPAGTKLFGNISVFDTVSTITPYSTQVNQRRLPVLGRYAPYTFETQDGLRSATGSGSEVDLYPKGFNPGATSPNHCLGNTGGRLNVASTGDGGFTVGSFVQGEIITASSSGATGKVFGWHRNSATGGVILVYTGGTGGVLGFTGTETITAAAGHTTALKNELDN